MTQCDFRGDYEERGRRWIHMIPQAPGYRVTKVMFDMVRTVSYIVLAGKNN